MKMSSPRLRRASADLHKAYILSSPHTPRLAWSRKWPAIKHKIRPKKAESNIDISIPGMRRLCDPSYNNKQKFMWFLAILSCTIFCAMQIWDRFTYYQNAPVTLDIIVKRNRTITFPSITICPGTINFAFKQKLIIALVNKTQLNPVYKNQSRLMKKIDYHYFDFNKVNFSLDELWQQCKLDEKHVQITTPCNANDEYRCVDGHSKFPINITYLHSLWGICIVITPETDMIHRGPDTYINVRIREPPMKPPPKFFHNQMGVIDIRGPQGAGGTFSAPDGFKPHRDRISNMALQFFLHPKGIRARHDSSFLVESLLRGFFTQVRFTIKEFYYSSKVGCRDMLAVKKCRNKLMDIELDKILNCSLPFLTKTRLPRCKTLSDSFKAFENASRFYAGEKFYLDTCGRPCTDIIYSLTTDVVYELGPQESETFVQFYYPDNLYEKIEEHCSYTLSAFFSDLSANLGFFLGFCMLTLVEMLEALFKRFK